MNEQDEHVAATEESGGGMSYELLPHQCPRCLRKFKSKMALRMHRIRAHSNRNWDTSKNFHSKNRHKGLLTEAERKEKKRQYQTRLRNRYYREGKNARGQKMPAGWKPRGARKTYKRSETERAKARAYQKALYHRKKAERQAKLNGALASLEHEQPQAQTDSIGEAAKAILVAAKVLRATVTAMKLPV